MARIYHFSDLHLPVAYLQRRLRDYCNKRALGLANLLWRGRLARLEQAPAVLKAFSAQAAAQKPDLLVCTGDFSSLAFPEEFLKAADFLRELPIDNSRLLICPGNHDRYTRQASIEKSYERFLSPGFTSTKLFRLGERHALIGFDSTATRPWLVTSWGRVYPSRLEILEQDLKTAQEEGREILFYTHYPHYTPRGRPEGRSHGLLGAHRLLSLLARYPVRLYLHGHIHRPYLLKLRTWPFTFCCAGSLTMNTSWSFMEIDTAGDMQVHYWHYNNNTASFEQAQLP
jgi:3',5'-cyclic AMP phosphodiesterase CpdA